jgi:hypothetical protein
MRTNKIYLRNKIVYNFITDIRDIINRFIILNITCINDDNKIHIK